MPTTTETVTAELLLKRYADDIAYVAEAEAPATDLRTLSHHLQTAASNFDLAGINGHEDIDTASDYVNEADQAADATERDVFLRKADQLLYPLVWDMTREYRDMVGD
ncbi:hypothetical protein [Streptomyces sp. AS02]|uniref:hypothetical protein n=1 Tax=Streptomyces sp. AS02 TaxID=2938946 RepID=UPI00202139B3|nr:hypothetical protein [Streptomyces sp. AS02]MCL8016883.1 hypothetical protein [Streptomyces sp. AS02]